MIEGIGKTGKSININNEKFTDNSTNSLVKIPSLEPETKEVIKEKELTHVNDEINKKLPQNQDDFFRGDFYIPPKELKKGNGKQWGWRTEYNIDGLKTNAAELFILEELTRLRPRRNKDNKLEIIDSKTNKYTLFKQKDFSEALGSHISITEEIKGKGKINLGLTHNGVEFTKRFLPNLLNKGILREEDFQVMGKSRFKEIYETNERPLKKGLNDFVLSGDSGPARYYIGRNKIYSTETKINPDTMSIIKLDKNNFGIAEKDLLGKKKILYTFNTVTEKERENLVSNIMVKNQSIKDKGDISARILADMKGRIKNYDISNLFPQKSNEPEGEYQKRLSMFTDIDIVTKTVRDFTSKYSVPIMKLSWKEQLEVSAMLSTLTKDKGSQVGNLLKKYGIEGLRTFLSIQQGGIEMGDKILELGEKLPKNDADKIFARYSKIVDTTNQVINFLQEKYSKNNTSTDVIQNIQENLLQKGATLLKETSETLYNHNVTENTSNQVIKLLDQYREDILLFASTFKTLSEEQKDLSLEDVAGTYIQKLTKEDKEKYKNDIVNMNTENRKVFMSDQELKDRTERLHKTLKNEKIQFYGTLFEGKLVSSVSFEEQPNGSLLVESLNVAPSIKQSHIGNAFFETLIKELGKNKDIYGYVHKKNSDKLSFYEKLGFVVSSVIKDENEWFMIRYHKEELSKMAA